MAISDNLTNQLLIVLCIYGMLFIGQQAILDTNPNAAQFFDCQSSILSQAEASNCSSSNYVLTSRNATDSLPGLTQRVSSDQSSIWTDIFDSIKTWILDSTGLGFLFKIIAAPYTILEMTDLPAAIIFPIAAIWYLYTLFLLIGFMWGR